MHLWRFLFWETLTAPRGICSVYLQELDEDAENAPLHVLELSKDVDGSGDPWFNYHWNSSKLSDIPLSASFCRCVHFQSQTLDIAFKHRNFVV